MNEVLEKNRESYNKIANLFSQTRSFIWEDLKALNQYVQIGDTVLDLGCGNGRLLEILRNKNIIYLGVDNSEGLLHEAKTKYPDYEFRLLDLMNLDNLEKKFDIVFCISVLNHFPKKFHVQAIEKIKKVMNPGGELLMVNWNLWKVKRKKSVWRQWVASKIPIGSRDVMTTWKSGKIEADLYYYAFSKRDLRKLLENNGFRVLKNYYSLHGKRACWLCGDNIVTVAQFGTNNLEKKPSEIHGAGMFTKKKFSKGEEIYKIPMSNIRYKNYKRHAYVGNGQYVNDEIVLNYVNHSCRPNVVLDIKRPDPVLIAIRDLDVDEEILCNYDLTEKDGVSRRCHCGASNCKGRFGK